MHNPEITHIPKYRVLLLAGLWLIVPTPVSTGPAEAQDPSANVVHQNANAGTVTAITSRTDGNSHIYLHLAKVLVLKNELSQEPGLGDGSSQHVAPRLQSRIKKNTEFAAFVKLVKATSDKKYSPVELQRLYLSFKEWSHKNGAPSQ